MLRALIYMLQLYFFKYYIKGTNVIKLFCRSKLKFLVYYREELK